MDGSTSKDGWTKPLIEDASKKLILTVKKKKIMCERTFDVLSSNDDS